MSFPASWLELIFPGIVVTPACPLLLSTSSPIILQDIFCSSSSIAENRRADLEGGQQSGKPRCPLEGVSSAFLVFRELLWRVEATQEHRRLFTASAGTERGEWGSGADWRPFSGFKTPLRTTLGVLHEDGQRVQGDENHH